MKRKLTVKIICTLLSICMIALPCSAASYIYHTNKIDPNYDTTNLDKLYSTGDDTSWNEYLYNSGCYVTSYAMILSNLRLKTVEKFEDVRSSLTKYHDPDPFTVLYANCGFPTIEYDEASDEYHAKFSGDTISARHTTIGNNFNADYKILESDIRSLSNADKASLITEYVKKYPQGVALTFYNPNSIEYKYHMVVVTASSYVSTSTTSIYSTDYIAKRTSLPNDYFSRPSILTDEYLESTSTRAVSTDMKTFGKYFTVCDPVSTISNPGENVLLNKTWTATTYTFSQIMTISTFTVKTSTTSISVTTDR